MARRVAPSEDSAGDGGWSDGDVVKSSDGDLKKTRERRPESPSSTSVSFLNTGKRSVSVLREGERSSLGNESLTVLPFFVTFGLGWMDDVDLLDGQIDEYGK